MKASIGRQFCLETYVKTSMYIHLQASIGKNKEVETSVEWTIIDKNRHLFNSIGMNRGKSIDYAVDKSLYRHFSREKRKSED